MKTLEISDLLTKGNPQKVCTKLIAEVRLILVSKLAVMEYKEEILRLKDEIAKQNSDLEMAGQLGNTLLENNKEYQNRIEELSKEVSSAAVKIEELKQENHVLKIRIETEAVASRNQVLEQEHLKERLQKEFKEKEQAFQNTSEKKVKDLRKEIESLQNDLNKHTLVERQQQEKLQKQEELIENIRKYSEQLQSKAVLETEVEEERRISAHLQFELDSAVMNCSDLKDLKQRLEFDNEALKQEIERVNEELKEKSRQSETWYSCLQEARQESGELKAELQALKAVEASRNFQGKGNSLFGEVEDRRLELEKKFVSMEAEHKCLLKTYGVTKQQLHRLKNQVAALLSVKGARADSSQIERLETALAHSREEIKMLNAKLASIDKQQAATSQDSRMKEFHDAFSDFGDKKDYVDYLQLQLEKSKKDNADLKKEFQTKTLLQLSESDKLRYTEGQLHKAECNIERVNSENLKLRLRIDELRVKLVKYMKAEEKNEDTGCAIQQQVPNSKITTVKGSTRKPRMSVVCAAKPLHGVTASNQDKTKVVPDISQTSSKSATVDDDAPVKKSIVAAHGMQPKHQEQATSISHHIDEPLKTGRKREPSVRFDLPNLAENADTDEDLSNENELNSGPPQKRNRSPDHSSVFSATMQNERIKVQGQLQAPAVIHVKKDMPKKNECAHQ